MTQDFLIIGGGIAGVSAAARLSRLGSVTLLEAEPHLAHHASGRSAALFEPRYGAPAVVALSFASEAYHRHANGGVLSPRGLLLVEKAERREMFDADIVDMGLEEISLAQAQAMVPILNPQTVAFAAHADHAWDIDTDLLLQNFAREARANGAQLLTGSRVETVQRTGIGWSVHCANASYEARILINASGAWVDEIARSAGLAPLGFTPYRRSMARIPAPGGLDVSRWPMLFGGGEDWYAKPDAGALIVSPAEEHPMRPHDAWADDMVLAEGLARYEEMVSEPVTRVISNWAGLRTFAPDRVLVIGPSPHDSAFFWLAGQGGYGFQTAPAASQLLADLISGATPDLDTEIVACLAPNRLD
jgi:D-arginine dehydrogenase